MSISTTLFQRAQQSIPGGVNSPVRAFKSVGGTPLFIKHAKGPFITDVDNKQYIDYVGSWGPLILGHAHPKIIEAVTKAAEKGLSYGAPTEAEVILAEKICQAVPSIEQVRLVNSGTEATLSAIRLARAYTKRAKIIKFIGCYHGHHDALLIEAGSGALTFGTPSSPGIPTAVVADTLTAHFNDIESVKSLFAQHGDEIAAVIVEPIAANMNCILPVAGFLSGLRDLCNKHHSVLIFDEVITGFRVALGGAQQLYSIEPDLTTLGKIIGGGMPVGAFGGRKEIMSLLSPEGPVYQAGTLSGNPLATAAGIATLTELSKPDFYPTLEKTTQRFTEEMLALAKASEIGLHINRVASLFGLLFTHANEIVNFKQVMQTNSKHYTHYFHGMLAAGVYFAPSAFESAFISAAHTDSELDKTLSASQQVFKEYACQMIA